MPFLIIFFLPLYFLRLYQITQYNIPENKTVKLVGRITQQPYLKDSYQIIVLGPVLLKNNRFPGYFYGDKIQVIGKFQKKVINPFQAQYFASFPTIQKIEENTKLSSRVGLRRFLFKTRGYIEVQIGKLLPEPEGSLLLGIFFGVKSQMPQDFWQNLRKTGTLHLVVASGQNVSMVAGFLVASLVWLMSRRRALILASLGIILYVLTVGAEPPAVRAGLMAIFTFLGQLLGREGKEVSLLLVAAGMMLLISPLMLFDVGFQLSFAAMAGIILIYPRLRGGSRSPMMGAIFGCRVHLAHQRKRPNTSCSDTVRRSSDLGFARSAAFLTAPLNVTSARATRHSCQPCKVSPCGAKVSAVFSLPIIGDGLAVTISAQLATLPILLVNFGQFSWLSPLINALILPTIPLIMGLGGIIAGLVFLSEPLAQVPAWLVWLPLAYFVKIIDWFGNLSWVNWDVGKLSAWWAVGYYLILWRCLRSRFFG